MHFGTVYQPAINETHEALWEPAQTWRPYIICIHLLSSFWNNKDEREVDIIVALLCFMIVMDAVKFVNCEKIHMKVWFIRSTMYTNIIKSVKTDQFDRSIRWLQIAMQTSIKRWYIGHRVFFPFWHYITIHFSLVWIFWKIIFAVLYVQSGLTTF